GTTAQASTTHTAFDGLAATDEVPLFAYLLCVCPLWPVLCRKMHEMMSSPSNFESLSIFIFFSLYQVITHKAVIGFFSQSLNRLLIFWVNIYHDARYPVRFQPMDEY
ncbi:MAG: hypothetical protein IJ709_10485, partial [Selenomonas sp.]|nr:hypothetical protein [Selenomonas sp.]